MSSEHRNRTNKAQAIAAALVTVGVTAGEVAELPPATWRIAALAGWHIAKAEQVEGIALRPWTTVSDATREMVRELLAADEAKARDEAEGLAAHQVDDVFASIAAPAAAVRPAQSPDAPLPSSGAVRVSAAGVPDLHPAARHTLNCLATSGGRTGCSC